MRTKQTEKEKDVGEGLSDQARDALGDAFGKIEEAQRSIASVNTPLIKYLLDIAKLEIARKGSGLPVGSLGERDPAKAWVKALLDEEADERPDRRLTN